MAALDPQTARIDEDAESTDPDLPAFIARPKNAPAYYGFPRLPNSELDGFSFGIITAIRQDPPSQWGDAYVIAPNGSRAGLIWQVGEGPIGVSSQPHEGCWGVYSLRFPTPPRDEEELTRYLQAKLPELKLFYAAAERDCPESTKAWSEET